MLDRIIKFFLAWVDRRVTNFLQNNPHLVPDKWKKFIAINFPDARIRKTYWATQNVNFGEGTFANLGFYVVKNSNENSKVEIGHNVSIAPGVIIITDSSPNNSSLMQSISYVKEKLICERAVNIEDDVWIGAGVIIFPGVLIGKGAIIGAGAIVKDDVAPFTIVAGSPARELRKLTKDL